MNVWHIAIIVHVLAALITLIPTIKAMQNKIILNPGGDSFDKSPLFSDDSIKLLKQHFSRIEGTLKFWKNKAEKYHSFHNYCIFWTISISVLIPIFIQFMDGSFSSKLFLTILSVHMAISLAFYRGFNVENNYKAFRQGESEFYDIYRRLLDNPKCFGENENEQLSKYFKVVENIRKNIRNAETENLPNIDETISKLS